MSSLHTVCPVPPGTAISAEALLSPEVAGLLAEVGFLAIDQKDWSRACQIFSTIREFRMDSECPYVGLALTEWMRFRPAAAAEWVKAGLTRVPDSRALAFLQEAVMRQGVVS